MSSSRSTGPHCREPAVLLLDPDPDFREALAANLKEDGHEVNDSPGIPLSGGFSGIESLVSRLDGLWVLVTTPQIVPPSAVELLSRISRVSFVLLDLYASRHLERMAAANPKLAFASKPSEYDHVHQLIHRVAGVPPPGGILA